MIEKKYTIFVSSTYTDLKEERRIVIEAIVAAGHIPIAMEYFTAGNQEQFEFIKPLIDKSDYYILIVAGKYGSISEITNKSYTEMEYDYAIERGVPVASFLLDDEVIKNRANKDVDKEKKKIKLLAEFKKKISAKKMCRFFSDQAELGRWIRPTIDDLIKLNERPGWVRTTDIDLYDIEDNIKGVGNKVKLAPVEKKRSMIIDQKDDNKNKDSKGDEFNYSYEDKDVDINKSNISLDSPVLAELVEKIKRSRNSYDRSFNKYKKNDIDGALLELSDAISRYSHFAEAYYIRALIEYEKGEVNAAVNDILYAKALKPDVIDKLPERNIMIGRMKLLDNAIDKSVYSNSMDELISVPTDKKSAVVIPPSVTNIADLAFFNCKDLTSIEIPTSVRSIGKLAFHHCNDLTSIVIPNSVKTIGDLAFSSCNKLYEIHLKHTIPPTFVEAFKRLDIFRVKLVVPRGSTLTYIANDFYSQFKEIIEEY